MKTQSTKYQECNRRDYPSNISHAIIPGLCIYPFPNYFHSFPALANQSEEKKKARLGCLPGQSKRRYNIKCSLWSRIPSGAILLIQAATANRVTIPQPTLQCYRSIGPYVSPIVFLLTISLSRMSASHFPQSSIPTQIEGVGLGNSKKEFTDICWTY